MSGLKKFANSTRNIANLLLPSALIGVSTYLNYSTKEKAREMEDQATKDMVKNNLALVNSTLGTVAEAVTGYDFLVTLVGSRVWEQLNAKQLGMVILSGALGVGGLIYSSLSFGNEKNLAVNGAVGSTSALSFQLGSTIMKDALRKNALLKQSLSQPFDIERQSLLEQSDEENTVTSRQSF